MKKNKKQLNAATILILKFDYFLSIAKMMKEVAASKASTIINMIVETAKNITFGDVLSTSKSILELISSIVSILVSVKKFKEGSDEKKEEKEEKREQVYVENNNIVQYINNGAINNIETYSNIENVSLNMINIINVNIVYNVSEIDVDDENLHLLENK